MKLPGETTNEETVIRRVWRWLRERMSYSGMKWFVLSVLLVLVLAAILSPLFWSQLSDSGTGTPDSTGSTIRNVVLIVGAVLALPLAIWRGKVAENQVVATQMSVNATHQAIANQRFQAAAEMLGHDLNAARLGAIKTLRNLSKESPADFYLDAMTLLAAFVRQPPVVQVGTIGEIRLETGKRVREDVQVAIWAIGERSEEERLLEIESGYKVELSGTRFASFDLRNLNMQGVLCRGANFRSASLAATRFEGADLTGSDFGGSDLYDAKFERADVSSCNFSQFKLIDNGSYDTPRGEAYNVKGLVQTQLDSAICEDGSPPKLRNVRDAETDQPLTWQGASPEQL